MIDIQENHMGPRPFIADTRRRLADLRFQSFEIIRQSPSIGGEVCGLDLREPLSDETLEELETALVELKVLFFRDQSIDVAQQGKFARRFGELEQHPFLPSNTTDSNVIRFEKDETTAGYENTWHSDVSWRQVPSLGSVLHGIEIPAVGGDTLWCDMEAAYEGLDEITKERIDGLVAVHDFTHSFGMLLGPDELAEKKKEFPAAHHPVVRTHPVSGRKCIYVNSIFTSHIEGIPREEGDAILARLYRQAQVPEYQCRFRWSKGAVAFWDNRSTQHYASNDYHPERRVAERVTIIGDRPR